MSGKETHTDKGSSGGDELPNDWELVARETSSHAPQDEGPTEPSMPANYAVEVFDKARTRFNPSVPGFGRDFSFIGNTIIEGDIPPNVTITVHGGALILRVRKMGYGITLQTRSLEGEERVQQLDMWREHVALSGSSRQKLLEPVEGIAFEHAPVNESGEHDDEGAERIQIKPLDIYIECDEWPDRSDIEKAFEGDPEGHGLHIISAGSVFFNGNTPPHTYLGAVGDCYIGGTTGAVTLSNIGGERGLHCKALGSVNTATVFGDVAAGQVLEDCAITSNGKVSVLFGIGEKTVITAARGVELSQAFLDSISDDQKIEVLRRITTSGQITTTTGQVITTTTQAQVGDRQIEQPKPLALPAPKGDKCEP